MKFEAASGAARAGATADAEGDRGTRQRVCREVLERGPVTATQLAQVLGLTPAAVRRHLDLLLGEGLAEVWVAEESGRRGRGRPARRFVLTDAGHAAMSTGYDDLAASALDFLAEVAGEGAVREFAARRADQLTARYAAAVDAAGPDPRARAQALAGVLTADGYAATTRALPVVTPARGPGRPRRWTAAWAADATPNAGSAGNAGNFAASRALPNGGGVEHPGEAPGSQLCQGHCPVQHVAARFPQLCEAETQAFSTLLGVHVQRLATLAHGEHVCTTHVPGKSSEVAESMQVRSTIGRERSSR